MQTPKKILILGGTAEARHIAARLFHIGHDVTSSLAGVTLKPLLPEGKVRVGGFGGPTGLRALLEQEKIEILIDATHPYAAIISNNAFEAVQNSATQLMRFERPAWQPAEGDHWITVASFAEAASRLPAHSKVFITTGRKELAAFFNRGDVSGVIRTVEPPTEKPPSKWHVILDRPPHTFENELALFKQHAFSHIISKNAGSDATRAKLDAARELGLPVVMIERPFKPACATFTDVVALTKQLGT